MKKVSVLFLACLCLTASASAELAFDAGKCVVGDDGSIAVESKEGGRFTVSACVVLPNWRFHTQVNAAELKTEKTDPDRIELSGKLKAGKTLLPFSGTVSRKEGALEIRLSCELPPELKTQNNLPVQLHFSGSYGAYEDGLLRMGPAVSRFSASNFWQSGDRILLEPFQMGIEFVSGKCVLSLWSNAKAKTWNIRANMPFTENPAGRLFSGTVRIAPQKVELKPPVDLVQLKREQYLRILTPPMEPQFRTEKLLEKLNDPKLDGEKLTEIENLLDARSLLVSLQDMLNHKPEKDEALRKLMSRAWEKLNACDAAGVRAMFPELKTAFRESASWMPLVKYNPYSWIKSFTWQGFIKHPEGVLTCEPNPWCIIWQDGFRFNAAQDPAVSIANTHGADPNFFETRFSEPMPHVTAERSWTGTKWKLPDREITFSVLVPLIDVAGTDTLVLSGFSSPPDRLSYLSPGGLSRSIRFGKPGKHQPEVIASALMDYKDDPPEAAPAASAGMQPIDPEEVGRPWLQLHSASGWNLILLPGERPVEAGFVGGRFILKLRKKSYVGIVRLPPNLHFRELPAIAEFFAGVAAAYPAACRESVEGRKVTWSYTHELRPNAWGVAPRKIAPVSPLALLAGIPLPGTKKVNYPTKYGMLRYADGDAVSVTLPETLNTLPVKRGVNVSLSDDFAVLQGHRDRGAGSLRLFLGAKGDPGEKFKRYEELLRYCEKNDIRLLVDPHNFLYEVRWNTGFPTDPASEQRFLFLWDRLSQIGAKYKKAVYGYDLYNELGVKEGAEMRWKELAERCAKVIAGNHPEAMIYVTGVDGANPSGLFNYQPPEIRNLCATFHFYTPHSFTHQKSATRNLSDPSVFYPGYVPHTDWAKRIHYGGTNVEWFDRWTLGAAMLPAFETYAEKNIPMHCGEFSVIGYANAKSPEGAFLWTRDVVELLEHCAFQWNLWNGGFGMGNQYVKQYMYDLWKR